MKFQVDIPIYGHLANLFTHQQAVVFCGSGVSREPPAGLPGWPELRDYTLEAVASKDPILQKYLGNLTTIEMIAQPGKKGLTPEYVASRISGNCPGYFECFRALEEGEPNANHRYLAKMVKAGCLKYIVTTNFDLFIEQGMEKEGLPYRVYRTEDEFAGFARTEDKSVHIFKLHGCIREPTTITATVEQESKGLSRAKARARVLRELLAHYHFIFWGYSGADLKIDLDYLGMVSMKEEAQGFVWNFLQQEQPNPHVVELQKLYSDKGHIVHGKLPEIFDLLLAPEEHIERIKYTQEEENAWQEEKNRKLAQSLRAWAGEHVGQPHACHIFGVLLQHSGQMEDALVCYRRMAEIAKAAGDARIYASALHSIGLVYEGRGEYDAALECFQEAEKIARKSEDKGGLAPILNSIGGIHKVRGQYKEALKRFCETKEIAEERGDKKGCAAALNNIGGIYHVQNDFGNALDCYQEAERIDRELGDIQSLASALHNIGWIHHVRGEYHKALERFREAEKIDRQLGDEQERASDFRAVGGIHRILKEYGKALERYREAEKIDRQLGDTEGLALDLNNLGTIYKDQREYDKALESLKEALQIADSIQNIPAAEISENIGLLYGKYLRQPSQAIDFYEKSIAYFRQLGQDDKVAELRKRIKRCRERRE